MVRPIRGVRQRLGARRDVAAMVQDDVADELPDLGTAGFAGTDDGTTVSSSHCASRFDCVVLPEPSPPSSVIHTP